MFVQNVHTFLVQPWINVIFVGGERGKYAKGYPQGSNIVVLDPDVAQRFPNSEAVNQTFRSLAEIQDRKGA
jgi:hypothetical protein